MTYVYFNMTFKVKSKVKLQKLVFICNKLLLLEKHKALIALLK